MTTEPITLGSTVYRQGWTWVVRYEWPNGFTLVRDGIDGEVYLHISK